MAYVISDACISCGACEGTCPAGAISEGDGQYVIDAESPPPDVIRHPALRSPDFPHLAPFGPASRDYISYFVKNGTSDS